MKRRAFLGKAGLGAVAGTAAIAAPAMAQQNPKISWKMASTYGPNLPPLFGSAEVFCKMIEEASGGQFTIRLYPGGEVVPGFGVLDAVGNRTVDCGQSASYYYYGKDPTLCFDTAVPFGLNARQMNAWMDQGDGLKLMREVFALRHIVNFPMGNTGTQMGGWYRKEIKSVADLKGLKMRTAGFAGEVLSRVGVIPQQISPGDIYPSLEKGALDAVEFVGPLDDEKLSLQRVAKYYYYPGWWEGSAQVSLYVNEKAYAELPKQYQSLIALASRYAGQQLLTDYDAHNANALRRLVASGAELRAFPVEVLDACYDAAQEVYAEFNAKYPQFKKVYDNYMGFRDQTIPWFRLAEGSYDSYLNRALNRAKQQ
jgi:TRAP-type mannitol/chloroaromatic compound transport system substrate-binding protein